MPTARAAIKSWPPAAGRVMSECGWGEIGIKLGYKKEFDTESDRLL